MSTPNDTALTAAQQEARDAESALRQALADAESVTIQQNPNQQYVQSVASRVQAATQRVADALGRLADHPNVSVDSATVDMVQQAANQVSDTVQTAQTANTATDAKNALKDATQAAQDVHAAISDATVNVSNGGGNDNTVSNVAPVGDTGTTVDSADNSHTTAEPATTPNLTGVADMTPPYGDAPQVANTVQSPASGGSNAVGPVSPTNPANTNVTENPTAPAASPNVSIPVPQATSADAPQVSAEDVGVLHTAPQNVTPDTKEAKGNSYTVKADDTLASIAAANDVDENSLYLHNIVTIERTAVEHGRTTSNAGGYLYPGTELHIPQVVRVETEE